MTDIQQMIDLQKQVIELKDRLYTANKLLKKLCWINHYITIAEYNEIVELLKDIK